MDTELVRNCSATAIPSGEAVTLDKGEKVFITQTLGGNVTVRARQGLYRIASLDVDALADFDGGENSVSQVGDTSFSEDAVWNALKQCFDPEIPINIVDLGLIYDLRIEDLDGGRKAIFVKMTLTAQGCGMGPVIAQDAKVRVEQIDEVENAEVEIVWDPVWNPQMISDEGRKVLGIE